MTTNVPTNAPEKEITLGDIAVILRDLHAQGVTLGAMRYVIDQVWWKELDEEAQRREEAKRIAEEARAYLASRGQNVKPN